MLSKVYSISIYIDGGLKVVVDDEGGLRSTGYIAKTQGLFEIDFGRCVFHA